MTKILKPARIAMAMAAGLTAAVPAVQAVNQTDNGLGEVGLIPYYTVRNNFDTYLSIVNTSDTHVIAVKVRFRERENSRDARDFNVFLSPNDVWTATVTMGDNGGVMTPRLVTSDNSCTAPQFNEVWFTNLGYTASAGVYASDGGGDSITRTYDGHVEIIQMGSAIPVAGSIAANAVHVPTGANPPPGNVAVPLNCGAIAALYANNQNQPFVDEFGEPINVMKVAATLVNTVDGLAISLPVDNLANFFNPDGIDGSSALDIMYTPDSTEPDLAYVAPSQAIQIENTLIQDSFNNPIDAVSSLFMAADVVNEYGVGGPANARNDWVLTFPTKFYYTDSAYTGGLATSAPFTSEFQAAPAGFSCERISNYVFDREEQSFHRQPGFSPETPNPYAEICFETNLVSFRDDLSALAGTIDLSATAAGNDNIYVVNTELFDSGWMRMEFAGANATGVGIVGDHYTYYGLPVTGFGAKTYLDGQNYGFMQEHAYHRRIELHTPYSCDVISNGEMNCN